jgi:hypothetical protein
VKLTGSGERGVIKEESRKNEGKYWLGVGYHWWKSDFFQGLKKTGEYSFKEGREYRRIFVGKKCKNQRKKRKHEGKIKV